MSGGSGLLYEEFRVGQVFTTAPHVLTREGISAFAELTGDTNPLHTDPAFAQAAGFPDVLAHGMYVQSLAIGLIADLGIMTGTTIALLGAQSTFRRAAFPGDEIRARVRISRKRSTSSPGRGVLWRQVDILNQDDVVLATVRMVGLMRRRDEAAD
jgi:acyl dehydratase